MNTLKPLLIVAVLAGIGYGVYIRINSGHDAPPPGVAEGWENATPRVQLPESGAAVWGPGGGSPIASIGSANNSGRGMPPAQPPLDNAPPANPYQNNAPPQGPPGAPPSAGASPYGDAAPPYGDPAPGVADRAMPNAAPGANPYDAAPPYDPRSQAPTAGEPANAPPAEYGAPAADRYVQPAENPPVGGAPPATENPSGSGAMAAIEAARRELEAGQMASALRQLSMLYDDPRLTAGEQQQLTQLLDQVAGTVVYSTQHLLAAPCEVQPGERLEDIAQRYNVPWQLLAKINGIEDPQSLRAGERLKVVQGPFNAVISLDKRQLILFLSDGSYAGRFPIGIGAEHPPQEGVFAVSDKVVNPVYHGRDQAIAAGDQNNPLGDRWIGLGREMGLGIHGTNRPENIGRTDLPGSISLTPGDVSDVFDILSLGSKVTIRR